MLLCDAPQYMYSTLFVHLDLIVTQVNTYSLSVYSKHWPWSGENSSSWPRFKFKTRSRSLKRGEPNTVILLERATQLLSNRVGSLHVSNDDAPLSSPTQLLVLISLRVDYPQHNLFKIYILSCLFHGLLNVYLALVDHNIYYTLVISSSKNPFFNHNTIINIFSFLYGRYEANLSLWTHCSFFYSCSTRQYNLKSW